MELLAGSLNVQVDGFLHAGYLSASPRTFTDMAVHTMDLTDAKVIDVKAALQLQEPAGVTSQVVPSQAAAPVEAIPLAPASMASDGLMLAGLFFFFAFLISLYYRRIRKIEKPKLRPWLGATLAALTVCIVVGWAYPQYEQVRLNQLPPPWADVPVRAYQDPQAATEAILHALVAPALPAVAVRVDSLAAIQREVAFPVAPKEYTTGMTYAQQTYGRDGWGQEFQIRPLDGGSYRVSSGGADGAHDTPDDIVLVTSQHDAYNWEQLVPGLFVRPAETLDGDYTWLIHRVSHRNFRSHQAGLARQTTGNNLFDMFTFDVKMGTAIEPYLGFNPSAGRPDSPARNPQAEPLLFIQFAAPDNG